MSGWKTSQGGRVTTPCWAWRATLADRRGTAWQRGDPSLYSHFAKSLRSSVCVRSACCEGREPSRWPTPRPQGRARRTIASKSSAGEPGDHCLHFITFQFCGSSLHFEDLDAPIIQDPSTEHHRGEDRLEGYREVPGWLFR